MPLTVIQPSPCNYFSSAPSQNISMERKIFGNIRSKMTRKNSNNSTSESKKSAPLPTRNSNPFMPTPTRRPNRYGANAFNVPSNEPPPAYTPTAPAVAPIVAGTSTGSDDDRYAFLSQFDTVFVIDDSGSMVGRSWKETQKALEAITPICTSHDTDGIDLYFLNAPDSPWYQNVTSAATVSEIFNAVKPRGQTFMGKRLNNILKPYLARYAAHPERTKPMNIIVITDGEPSDDPESVIISAAKKLDKLDAPAWQVGIQFFQVGKEPGAREYLRQLDDEIERLAGVAVRDMVDTQPWTNDANEELNAEGILKTVLGGVNKRLDRRSDSNLYGPVNEPEKKRRWL